MTNNLEKLIKQSVPFGSETLKAEVGMLYVSYHSNYAKQQFFKRYKLTIQQYNILRILKGQQGNPANINLLKDRMLDKMSDASRLVDRLSKMGYVSKKSNPKDKRNADVFITPSAIVLLHEINEAIEKEYSIFSCLSEEEIMQFNVLIDKILEPLL